MLVRSRDQQLRGVYRSVDGGDSWSRLPAPLSLFDSNGRGHGFFDNFVAVDPRDANVAYLGGVELWKTPNGGLVWILLSHSGNQRIIHEDQFSIAFKPDDPDTVYVGNDAGMTHLAAALGVPTVALFGPTNPTVWQPLGPQVRVLGGDGTVEDPFTNVTVERARDIVASCVAENA